MNITELPVALPCGPETLVGVLSVPPAGMPIQAAVLIVVGGPQYRCGSHRQFVLLARRLAAAGCAALRFDVRGMGDSSGAARSFEALDEDIEAALGLLVARLPAHTPIALWGLCDGASAALMYWNRRRDARVCGMALLNPWLRSPAGLASTHLKHYYRRRVLQPEFWRKLADGGVAWRALRELLRNVALTLKGSARAPATQGDFRAAMASGWASFEGPILVALSGDDYTAKEFLEGATKTPAWTGAWERPGLTRIDFEEADHTFSNPRQRQVMESAVVDWLRQTIAPLGKESRV